MTKPTKPARPFFQTSLQTLRRWIQSSGKDMYESLHPDSLFTLEARTGAGVFTALFVLSLAQAGPWRDFDFQLNFLLARTPFSFWSMVLFHGVLLMGYAAVGMFLGVVWRNAWASAAQVFPSLKAQRFRDGWRVAVTAAGTLALHACFLFSDILSHPALYQSSFFQRGRPLRLFQIFITDFLPLWILGIYKLGVGLVFALALFLWAKRRWTHLVQLSRPAQIARGVGIAGLAFFALGLWAVRRFHAPKNQGPNVVILAVDSLRSDILKESSLAPRMSELARQGQVFSACVPPLPEAYGALATLFTGKTPLAHGIRHPFSPSQDVRLGPESLPARLKQSGYTVAALSDSAGDFFSRVRPEFDKVRAPESRAPVVLRQRVLQNHVHFLPYVSGLLGRRLFPSLRNMPELADPDILAEEALSFLKSLRFEDKFFLTVYFSSLHEPYALSSPMDRAFLKRDYRGPCRYALPSDPAVRAQMTDKDRARARGLYQHNVRAVDRAVGRVLDRLKRYKLDENTVVVLWSPYGEHLYEKDLGQGHGQHLRGKEVLFAPLAIREPLQKAPPRWASASVRAQDISPTLLTLLGLPVPEGMEGFPLSQRDFHLPPEEFFLAYAETGLWTSPEGGPPFQRIPYPGLSGLLEQDPDQPGRFQISSLWEDHVLVSKHRMIQVGQERLIYIPTPQGVVYELYDFSQDPDGGDNLAGTRKGAERVKELKEVLFRYLARERGWRPQNGYWIPAAFLRE
jgi:hypothetical protein